MRGRNKETCCRAFRSSGSLRPHGDGMRPVSGGASEGRGKSEGKEKETI